MSEVNKIHLYENKNKERLNNKNMFIFLNFKFNIKL